MSTKAEGDPTRIRKDAPAGLFLSRDGTWFHDGQAIDHERLAGLLHRSIARDAQGALIVTTGRDVLPFHAEDAPYVVRTLDAPAGTLVLSDGSSEPMPSEVHVDGAGRVRVRVKGGGFWALLSRPAAQVLLATINDAGDTVGVGDAVARVVTGERAHYRD